MRRQDANGHKAAHPARRAFFFGSDELEGTGVRKGLSVHRVGNDYCGVVHVRGHLGYGVDHHVSVGSVGFKIEEEFPAVRLVRDAERLQQLNEFNACVGLVDLGVFVEDGESFVGKRGQRSCGPLRGFVAEGDLQRTGGRDRLAVGHLHGV